VKRVAAGALALGLVLTACTSDDAPSEEAEAVATTTTSTPSEVSVRLGQVLVREDALPGFRTVVENRNFSAQRAARINLCGEDLRSELRIVSGRQSRFTDGEVEVTHTVTSGGDTNDALVRFQEVVDGCAAPWTEPALPNGGGPVEREITGTYPVPDVGVDGAAAIVRSTNRAGSTDTIVVVLVQGAVVSSLSVSGPLGSDFDVVDTAIQAAADRLRQAQSAATP
jgi:hypothetical protein